MDKYPICGRTVDQGTRDFRRDVANAEHTLQTHMKSMIANGFLELNEVHCLDTYMEWTYRSTFLNFE